MPVRVSPISRAAAILIILVGIVTFLFVNPVAGIAFVALGAALYVLLYKLGAKFEADLAKVDR